MFVFQTLDFLIRVHKNEHKIRGKGKSYIDLFGTSVCDDVHLIYAAGTLGLAPAVWYIENIVVEEVGGCFRGGG